MAKKHPQKQAAPAQTQPQNHSPFASYLDNQWIHIGLMALLTVFLFGEFLFSDKVLSTSDQLTGVDSRTVLVESLRNGQLPTWLPTRLGGMPSIDASFGDAMYLPSLATYFLFPPHRALGLRMVFHVFLAGLFFYLMLKRGFKLSPFVSCVGAVLYMLNPEFVSHVYPGHDGKMYVIAWLPFIVWRLKVLMESPKLLNATLLALGIAISEFTNHTQMTYFVLWGLGFYWLQWLVLKWRENGERSALVAPAGLFWVAVILGLGMAFLQFYPVYAFVSDAHSVRGVDRGFDFASSWSLHWPEFFSLWIPEFGGFLETYWSENPFKLNSEYAGAVALILAVLAVVFKPKPWRIFWAAIALLAVFFALGAHTPVFYIAYNIAPGVKKMRACSMMMFWFSFPVVLLAALFLGDVMSGVFSSMENGRKKKWLRGLLITVGAITLVTLIFSNQGFTRGFMQGLTEASADQSKAKALEYNLRNAFPVGLWLWWVFATVTVAGLWATLSGKISKHVFVLVVLVAGIIDTTRIDTKFIKVISKNQHFFTDPTLQQLRTGMKSDPFRCFSLPGTLPENGEGVHGLEGVGGFHDNELQIYRDFRGDQRNSNFLHNMLSYGPNGQAYLVPQNMQAGNNFLNLANVRYLLTRQSGRIIPIQNRNALGRLSFAPTYTVIAPQELPHALRENTYDIRTTVALHEEPLQKPSQPPLADSTGSLLPVVASVNWRDYSTNYRKAVVTVPRDGFLRLSEVYYPGWEVRVDGSPVHIMRSDGAWMAVYLPDGEHVVEMYPKSMYLAKAGMVSWPLILLTAAFWGWHIAGAYRKKKARIKETGKANA